MSMKSPHPAVASALELGGSPAANSDEQRVRDHLTTSTSLARALSIGLLSRLELDTKEVSVWDPAVGTGFAGLMLTEALENAGVQVRIRGQDIDAGAVQLASERFAGHCDSEFTAGDVLAYDEFADFHADLVLVDPPWAMSWNSNRERVENRQKAGEFQFGLPRMNDSTWLFVSLALEKLRPVSEGGGRVAALVTPSLLSQSGPGSEIRRNIVDSGLLESITRLPEKLTPATNFPLYLLTFSNLRAGNRKVRIADMQTQFTTEGRQRTMSVDALSELERGLRTGKPGPRNRAVDVRELLQHSVEVERLLPDGTNVSWNIVTQGDTAIDEKFLEARYGPVGKVSAGKRSSESFNWDPGSIFGDGSGDLLQNLRATGWVSSRLSALLAQAPYVPDGSVDTGDSVLNVPTTREGRTSCGAVDTDSKGRAIAANIDVRTVEPKFLAAWLNTDVGIASRQRAIDVSSSGNLFKALRSDARSLMRWADELVVPVPPRAEQQTLIRADEQLDSFAVSLSASRAAIWNEPDTADEVVSRIAGVFDESIEGWIDQLPFPIASALWTAETAGSPAEKQRALIHAWEAIVTFHAAVLLAASRSDPGTNAETEAAIRATLEKQHLGLKRASFGSWTVIVERTSKELRRALVSEDADEVARIRRAFAGLALSSIERLISNELVQKLNEVKTKRNDWLGHTGYISEDVYISQISSLRADLRELRGLLGNVWSQLLLVRAGNASHTPAGIRQRAEVAVGTRAPFKRQEFEVGEPMMQGELYLARDGAQTPLKIGPFVLLRAAPSSAHYTTFFYNRRDGKNVRLVSYQYSSVSELEEDVSRFSADFGNLGLD